MIEFDGLKKLRSIGGGNLKAIWEPAYSDIGVDSYNLYIRKENDDVFHPEYRLMNLRNTITSAVIRTEADADLCLRNHYCYYVAVNAVEVGGQIDNNNYVRGMSVYGDGSEPVLVPDRKIAKVI